MDNRYISLNVKHLCESNNLTQTDFAELFGLGRSVVSMYIGGKSTPRLDTVIDICKHFNLSIDDFVSRDLSTLPKTQDDNVTEDEDCKMCALYENMLKDKERIINSLERENAALRGIEVPDESKSA